MTEDLKKVPNDEVELLAKKEEPMFLNIILKDKECLNDAMSCGIKSNFFRFSAHQYLYSLISKNHEAYGSMLSREVFHSIIDKQEKYSEAQKVKQKNYFEKVYHLSGVSNEDFGFLRKSISDRSLQEQAYNILDNMVPKVIGSMSNQGDVVADLQRQVNAIEGFELDNFTLTMGAEEGFDKAMDHIEDRREFPEKQAGIMTEIKAIDDEYFGFERGSYTVISGMTNGGKTTLMFNIAFNMARAGHNVVYVSLEKKAVPMFTRLLSLHAMVDYNRIKRGGKQDFGLPDHIYDLLKKARDDLRDNIQPNLDIVQMSQGVNLSAILSEVDKIKNKKKSEGKKIDVLVLDYLGCVAFETHHSTRPDLDQAFTSRKFMAYGQINNFVTITAIQIKAASTKEIRKKAEKVGDGEDISTVAIQSEDLAGSQEVIRDADNSLGVVLNADKPPTKMFVHSTKARDNEGHKTIALDFDGRIGRVSDAELEPGQIEEVDDLIYSNISEEDLFASLTQQTDLDIDNDNEFSEPLDIDGTTEDIKEPTGVIVDNEGEEDDFLESVEAQGKSSAKTLDGISKEIDGSTDDYDPLG